MAMMPGMMPPPMDAGMGGAPPPPGLDPGMMGGAPAGPQFPSLDPAAMGQLLAPVFGIQQQDLAQFQGQQQETLMQLLMAMMGNAPNPEGYAAQSQPGNVSPPDMSAPLDSETQTF